MDLPGHLRSGRQPVQHPGDRGYGDAGMSCHHRERRPRRASHCDLPAPFPTWINVPEILCKRSCKRSYGRSGSTPLSVKGGEDSDRPKKTEVTQPGWSTRRSTVARRADPPPSRRTETVQDGPCRVCGFRGRGCRAGGQGTHVAGPGGAEPSGHRGEGHGRRGMASKPPVCRAIVIGLGGLLMMGPTHSARAPRGESTPSRP